MMIEIILNITILIFLFGIPYFVLGYFVYRCFKKNQNIRASILLVILIPFVIIPGIYFGFLPGSSIYWDLKMSKDLTGESFILGTPELEYNSSRCFNGDGYSIAVYKTHKNYDNPSISFFENLPQKPSVRKHWEVERWKRTPPVPEEDKFIEFALMENNNNKELIATKKLVRKYLKEKGNLYSYFYFMHGTYPGDIDLFIISPKDKRIISINNNT